MVLITILRGFGVIFLLGLWRSHSEYQQFIVENLLPIYLSDEKRVTHQRPFPNTFRRFLDRPAELIPIWIYPLNYSLYHFT